MEGGTKHLARELEVIFRRNSGLTAGALAKVCMRDFFIYIYPISFTYFMYVHMLLNLSTYLYIYFSLLQGISAPSWNHISFYLYIYL